jgi:hypothetical protein
MNRFGLPFRTAAFANRLVAQFLQVPRFGRAVRDVPWFFSSLARYVRATQEWPNVLDIYPCLGDRHSDAGSASGHYFHQDLWAARKVLESGVKDHVDVGSRVDGFVAHCATFTHVHYVDLRPLPSTIPNLSTIVGNILELPYESNSVPSLSSLHVVEHIGLGRYGDDIDPNGHLKAIRELGRVLGHAGNLYFGIPIGRTRTWFNAQRIMNPLDVVAEFGPSTRLVDFAVVDDEGRFVSSAEPKDYVDAYNSCGLFHFRKDP